MISGDDYCVGYRTHRRFTPGDGQRWIGDCPASVWYTRSHESVKKSRREYGELPGESLVGDPVTTVDDAAPVNDHRVVAGHRVELRV